MSLPPKNESLAGQVSSSKEKNVDKQGQAGTVHARVQTGSGATGQAYLAPAEPRRLSRREQRFARHRHRATETDPRTKAYMAKRASEEHSKLEAIRCPKRYIARGVFCLIRQRNREIGNPQIGA